MTICRQKEIPLLIDVEYVRDSAASIRERQFLRSEPAHRIHRELFAVRTQPQVRESEPAFSPAARGAA